MRDTRPLVVQARDAETKKPIPGAEVSIAYPVAPAGHAPQEIAAPTGSDGIARLTASVPEAGGLMLEVVAQGYQSENQNVSGDAVRAVKPLHAFESINGRPVQIVVELFADPEPIVDLELPSGYKGLIKAEIQVRPDAPFTLGQRSFPAVVPPSGTVLVVGPPILEHAFGPDFRFHYADGAPLTRRAEQSDLGYWWLCCDETSETFLVGTQLDYDTYRRTHHLQDGVGGGRRGGGSSGGGRGGKHKGGGGQQPPADSGSTGPGSS